MALRRIMAPVTFADDSLEAAEVAAQLAAALGAELVLVGIAPLSRPASPFGVDDLADAARHDEQQTLLDRIVGERLREPPALHRRQLRPGRCWSMVRSGRRFSLQRRTTASTWSWFRCGVTASSVTSCTTSTTGTCCTTPACRSSWSRSTITPRMTGSHVKPLEGERSAAAEIRRA